MCVSLAGLGRVLDLDKTLLKFSESVYVLLLSPVVLFNKSVQCLISGCLISLNTERSAVLITYLYTDMSTNHKMKQKWAQIHSTANTLLYTFTP